MGGFYLAYENDYTDILLPSILHPCKSSLRGRGFSPTQRGKSVKNRSTNRKDKSNSVAKGGPKDPCTMGYTKETVRNGVGARMDIICLMLAGPSIHASRYSPPCSDWGSSTVTRVTKPLSLRYCGRDIKLLAARLPSNIEYSSIRMNINGRC